LAVLVALEVVLVSEVVLVLLVAILLELEVALMVSEAIDCLSQSCAFYHCSLHAAFGAI
jgi:hypothetical protein